uniref:Transmembrane channel-like protein n=1 Tax=Spermophilus dauricus TaxID=99837 RepID=A0A8C9PMZ0_SPEDA
MEENRTWDPDAWGSSGEQPAPQKARGGQSLASVLHQLPSAATLRYRGPGMLPWGTLEEEDEDGERSRQASAEASHSELSHPSQAREQVALGSGPRTAHWARLLPRSKEKMKEGLRGLQPWAWTLKRIGGQFGGGTQSYFSLLRFLLLLNVLASVLQACMTLLPTWLEGAPPGPPGPGTSSPCGSYSPHTQGLVSFPTQLFNLLSGEGYLEWSPLFYGFYPPRKYLAVTYLCSVFAVSLICLLLTLHRSSVSGLKQTLLAESGALTSYSHQVFSAWDFGLRGDENVRLRQGIILYELQVELEEAVVRRQAAARTLGQQAKVWLVRLLVNLLVLALLAAAFYGVFWATGYTVELQEMSLVQQTPLLKLVVNYLPSIFISVVNFVLPFVFKLIAPLEGYTRSRQIVFILLRTVFLRLASLLVLLFSLWNQITCGGDAQAEDCKTCGYNYKELPVGSSRGRRIPGGKEELGAGGLTSWLGGGRSLGCSPGVPDEVLGLIYAQTVVWVGSFFCPLLPLLNTVKFLLLFYLKKVTLFFTCSPASRTFRASTANFFFPLVLLLGLAISAVPVFYSIFQIPPSNACGPFRGKSSIWAQIPESIDSLPQTTQNFLFFLGTQAFAVPLLLISSILMAYTVALANSYGRLISELKRQIKTEAQNKVFLAQRTVAMSSAKGASTSVSRDDVPP